MFFLCCSEPLGLKLEERVWCECGDGVVLIAGLGDLGGFFPKLMILSPCEMSVEKSVLHFSCSPLCLGLVINNISTDNFFE